MNENTTRPVKLESRMVRKSSGEPDLLRRIFVLLAQIQSFLAIIPFRLQRREDLMTKPMPPRLKIKTKMKPKNL
jgi:hypothetical protein